jgi:hypothetical protein
MKEFEKVEEDEDDVEIEEEEAGENPLLSPQLSVHVCPRHLNHYPSPML